MSQFTDMMDFFEKRKKTTTIPTTSTFSAPKVNASVNLTPSTYTAPTYKAPTVNLNTQPQKSTTAKTSYPTSYTTKFDYKAPEYNIPNSINTQYKASDYKTPEYKTPTFETTAYKTTQEPSFFDKAGEFVGNVANAYTANMLSGINQWNSGIASTADFLLPDVVTPSFVQSGIDYYKNNAEKYSKAATEANAKLGITGYGDTAVQAVTSAIPDAALAVMTGGTSLAPKTFSAISNAARWGASTNTFKTVLNTGKNIVDDLMRNPQFYTSGARQLGQNYEQAKAEGADEATAIATAFVTTALNSAVEVSGGLEVLPQNIKSGGVSAVKEWVKTALDEGKEEVVQSLLTNSIASMTYNPDMPLYSTTEQAVINPVELGENFAMGAIAGGVLGGGQIVAQGAYDNIATNIQNPTTNQRNNMAKMIDEDVAKGNITPEQGEQLKSFVATSSSSTEFINNLLTAEQQRFNDIVDFVQAQSQPNLDNIKNNLSAGNISTEQAATLVNNVMANEDATLASAAENVSSFMNFLEKRNQMFYTGLEQEYIQRQIQNTTPIDPMQYSISNISNISNAPIISSESPTFEFNENIVTKYTNQPVYSSTVYGIANQIYNEVYGNKGKATHKTLVTKFGNLLGQELAKARYSKKDIEQNAYRIYAEFYGNSISPNTTPESFVKAVSDGANSVAKYTKKYNRTTANQNIEQQNAPYQTTNITDVNSEINLLPTEIYETQQNARAFAPLPSEIIPTTNMFNNTEYKTRNINAVPDIPYTENIAPSRSRQKPINDPLALTIIAKYPAGKRSFNDWSMMFKNIGYDLAVDGYKPEQIEYTGTQLNSYYKPQMNTQTIPTNYKRYKRENVLADLDAGATEVDGYLQLKQAQRDANKEVAPSTTPVNTEVVATTPQRQLTFKEGVVDMVDAVARHWIDSGQELEKIAKIANDPLLPKMFNNVKQSVQSAEYNIALAQTDFFGNKTGKSLKDIFEPILAQGDDYIVDFSNYMYHRHNVDRMKQSSPVFSRDITANISLAEWARLETKYPEFKDHAKDVYTYNENLLKYRVQSGLASQDTANHLQEIYPNYVPTLRYATPSGSRANFNSIQVANTLKHATGGTENLLPLHEAMAHMTMAVVKAGKRNVLGNQLLLDAQNTDLDAVKVMQLDGEEYNFESDFEQDLQNQFTFYRDGKKAVLAVNNALYEGLKTVSKVDEVYNPAVAKVKAVNTVYKKLITAWNPIFAARNFLKDLQDALFYTQSLKHFTKNYVPAIKQMANNGELWQQYRAMGGFGGSIYDYNIGLNKDIINPPTGFKKAYKNVEDRIETINYSIEQLPRFTEFMAIVDKNGYKGKQIPYNVLMDAMYGAADITTNFGRSGITAKKWNASFVPFLNPSIQGFNKLTRTLTGQRGVRGYVQLIGKAALWGMLPSLINELMYSDDEDYQNLYDRDKDMNYLIKVDGTAVLEILNSMGINILDDIIPPTDNYWIEIPKGRVVGTIGGAVQRTLRMIQGDETAWEDYWGTVISNIAPVNPLTSNIFAAVLQTINNKTWYGTPINPSYMDDYAPGNRYDERTTILARAIGQTFNVSPKNIDYLLNSYTGVLGDTILPWLTPAASSNIPFVLDGKISNNIANDFYNTQDEIAAKTKAINGYTPAEIAFNENLASYLRKQGQAVSEINAQIKEIQNSNLPKNEKWDLVRELNGVADAIMLKALDMLPEYEKNLQAIDTGDKGTDYLIANYETFGADYAIKTYNSATYESQLEQGADLETYYADLVNRRLGELGEELIETPRGTYDIVIPGAEGQEYDYRSETLDKIAGAAMSPEDWKYVSDRIGAYDNKVEQLQAWGFDDYQVGRLTEEFVMSDTAEAKMLVAEEIGIDKDTYLQGYVFGYTTKGSKNERNAQIYDYVQELDLTDEQKTAMYDWLSVYSGSEGSSSSSSSGSSSGSSRSSGGSSRSSSSSTKKTTTEELPKTKEMETLESLMDFIQNYPQLQPVQFNYGGNFLPNSTPSQQQAYPMATNNDLDMLMEMAKRL